MPPIALGMKKIILQKGKEKSLQRFHPWVFSGAIGKKNSALKDGDVVEVYDASHNYLATGHFHDASIAVRIFSFQQMDTDKQFWKQKIERAIHFRKKLYFFDNEHTNMFRLINGEGDGMPGFIADWFNGHLVLQFHSYGMFLLKPLFVEILTELLGDAILSIYDKSASTMPELKGLHFSDELIVGNVDEVLVKENGHHFYIDIVKGQKTGFFIDQRESRKLVGDLSKGKRVLNLFCYTGGFSVYALANGAAEVHSVDISQKAIEYADRNMNMNNPFQQPFHSYTDNVFDFLDNMPADYYDIVIVDPPAFAKHHKVKEQGIKGYRNINRRAIEKIKKGGFLFTFSCSQAIARDEFQTLLFSSAVLENREMKVIKQLQQAIDHPIDIYHPEGSYLKGMMLYVE